MKINLHFLDICVYLDKPIDSYFEEYKDRGMAKWMTAFALGELTAAIHKTKADQKKDIPRLAQQDMTFIDNCLERSIRYNKVLDIQLNSLDELGRVKDHVVGTFRGFADMDTVVINTTDGKNQVDIYLDYRDIRHVIVHNFSKWSNTSDDNPFDEIEADQESDEFRDYYFNDGDFLE